MAIFGNEVLHLHHCIVILLIDVHVLVVRHLVGGWRDDHRLRRRRRRLVGHEDALTVVVAALAVVVGLPAEHEEHEAEGQRHVDLQL